MKQVRLEKAIKDLRNSGLSYYACNTYHYKVDTLVGILEFWPSTNKIMFKGKVSSGDVRSIKKIVNSFY